MIKFNGAQLENTTGLEEAIDNSPIGVAIVAQEIEEGELSVIKTFGTIEPVI